MDYLDPADHSATIEPAKVWPFRQAPERYRKMSRHGGDEDWVMYLPPSWGDETPEWANSGTQFGRCDVSQHKLENGGLLLIGAHA